LLIGVDFGAWTIVNDEGGAGQHDVEAAQSPRLSCDDPSGLDGDHVVDLEALHRLAGGTSRPASQPSRAPPSVGGATHDGARLGSCTGIPVQDPQFLP
jgi:hypothetical protein